MARPETLSDLQLRPHRRGRRRAALLVLNRARAAEVAAAHALATRWDRSPLTIAVDGGLRALRRAGLQAALLVGDGDSAPRSAGSVERIVYPMDKDFSDLGGALRETSDRGAHVAVIAGLLGGRLDHEWANVQEAGIRAPGFDAILAPSSRGLVLFTTAGCRARTAPERTLSLFALGSSATVTLRGTRWTLRRRRLRPGSRGLSNVTGQRLDLAVHGGVVALVVP